MDVDLLRPGTVPISPDTVLWFEFLLDQNLLKNHLSKPSPDPGACELMLEFLSVAGEQPNPLDRAIDVEAPLTPPASPPRFTRKQLALKILALKVAAILKWNLDLFEDNLPPHMQQQLIQDLVYMATDYAFSFPPQDITDDMVRRPHVRFALILYHRWVIRFPVKAALQSKATKINFMHLSGASADNGYNPMNPNFERVLRLTETNRMASINFLDKMLGYLSTLDNREVQRMKVPVAECFMHPTEESDDITHDWNTGNNISNHELMLQIQYDLCYNHFFYGQHDLAKKYILSCKESMTALEKDNFYGQSSLKQIPWGKLHYASVSKEDIIGYIRALNLGFEVLGEKPSLLHRLQESISNHYTGIIQVLQEDNLAREIALVHRQNVELDIHASASSGVFTVARDLLNRVSALNAVRYALDGGLPSSHPDFVNKFKTVGIKFVDVLFWALGPVVTSQLSEADWHNLRMFFLHLMTSQCRFPSDRIEEYLKKHVGEAAERVRRNLVSDDHLNRIVNDPKAIDDENMELPRELLTDDWETPDFEFKTVPELEMGRLKKKLIDASTADDVRMCLVKLAMTLPSTPLWKLNPSWKPAGSLHGALMNLPRGFLQDFGYVVSGASRARCEAGCARTALQLLTALEVEARSQLGGGTDPALFRLCRLLSWEVLLLQVNLTVSEWPHHRLNIPSLVAKCKACIAASSSGDSIVPRQQIVDACWLCVVNSGEWDSAGGPGGAVGSGTSAALAHACLELQRGKGARKLPRKLFDIALSVYGNSQSLKRTSSGQPAHRDSPGSEQREAFNSFLAMIRDPVAVNVACSLLARIYNVLTDDPGVEITVDYLSLWPNSIPNPGTYNAKLVLESLTDLLLVGLRLYPYNSLWLRVYGDVLAASGHSAGALRQYLCALSAGSGHFGKRAPDEGALCRRAARAAAALSCPTQAAALCQLTEDIDYATAFKCLSEKCGASNDGMDAYYGCVWDGTVAEVCVWVAARRGEAGRRVRAVRAAGALELNSNNTEDIQREAAAARRGRLLRALAKQYVS